jgi:S1-C subfamily serine protease
MYQLPDYNFKEIKNKVFKTLKSRSCWSAFFFIIAGGIIGFYASFGVFHYFPSQTKSFLQYFEISPAQQNAGKLPAINQYVSAVPYEQAIIDAAKSVSPSVVSIVISENVPTYEQQFVNPFGDLAPGFNLQIPQRVQNGTQYQEVGAGSGFIVSADGLILTNKHVVSDSKADCAVFTNDGKKYKAKVLALDPVQDLAVIKITGDGAGFKAVTLGDSSGIQIGQTAIAIGNALGQFSNTVSVGVVSGLGRTISASDQSANVSETLEGIIQTDAAVNAGNSGGPLLNLKGEVIGIDTAMAQGAQSIGFALPINLAKKDITQVIATNKIVYPFLGVRYLLVDDAVKQKYKLSVDYGALVLKGSSGEAAVTVGSAAAKAGIKENDVILEINGEKINANNSMAMIIQKYNVGDKITLHILRGGKEEDTNATLGSRSS